MVSNAGDGHFIMNSSQARRFSPGWPVSARGSTSDLSVFAIVLVCYTAGALLSWHSFGATAGLAFFPPAGVTVAAMVLLPRRKWWAVVAAVVVGELGVDLANGLSIAVAGGYAAANVVEPLVGASLFLRFTQGETRLDRRNAMRWFLVAAVGAGPLVAAVIGGLTKAGDSGVVWWDAALHWWIGDGLGVLAVGAPILALRGWAMPRGRRLYEAVVILSGALVLTALAYWVWELPPSIVLLPPLVWVALRFGTPGVLVVGAGIAAVANVATAAGHGLFATLDESFQNRLTMGQLFLATMIVTAWFLAVETTERAALVMERERQRAVVGQAALRRAIGELSERLVAAVSLDDVARGFLAVVADRYDVSLMSLVRYDPKLDRFRVVPESLPVSVRDEVATWTASTPAPGPVSMRLGAPIWIADRSELVREFPAMSDVASTLGVEAFGSLPLPGERGYIAIGRRGRPFEGEEREVLALMSGVIAVAVERVELFEAEHAARIEAHLANDKVAVLLQEATSDAARLRESEDRFRRLADDGPLLVWVHDADGHQEWVNSTFCEFFGVDRDAMKAGQWQLLVHPDDNDEYIAAFMGAVAEQREFLASVRVGDADGDWRWIESWARPRFDPSGRFIGHIGASADVTKTRQAQAELAAAHQFVSDVTNIVPGVISVFDLELGRDVFRSRQTLNMLGYDADEVIAFGERFIAAVMHPDDADAFAVHLVSAQGLADGEAASIDYRFRHRDGSWRWFRSTATPLHRTVDGKVAQLSSLSFDVTEQKAREAVLTAGALLDALRAHMTDALQDLVGSNEIEAAAAKVLTEHLESGSAHFAHIRERSTAEHEMAPIPSALVHDVDTWGETIARAIRDGERVVIDEIASDLRLSSTVREAASAASIASVVMQPLRESGYTPTGVLVVHRGERHSWAPDELKLIEETAARASHAAERDRARQARELQRRRATLIAEVAAVIELQATVEGAAQRLVELLVCDAVDYATFETFVPDHRILGIAHRAPERLGALRDLRTRHRLGADDSHASAQAGEVRQPQLRSNIVAADRGEYAVDAPGAVLLTGLAPRSHLTIPINMGNPHPGELLLGLSDPDGDTFTQDDLVFFTDLGRRVEILLAAKRTRQLEHQIAVTLQNALLPDDTRWHPAAAIEARYQAASDHLRVGGDWFDTYAWPDCIGVMVGDVVGHSLESAAAMGRLRAAASALAAVSPPSPAALSTALDRFARSADGVDYSTAAIVIVDPATGTLTYACAGHPPPLVITPDRQVTRLDQAQSPPLGALASTARTEAKLVLQPGSLVVLYTDGLIERRGESIDLGIERLEAALLDRFDQPISNIVEGLLADLTANRPAEDDIAVAAFRYTPLLAALHLEIPARADQLAGLRSRIRGWLTERRIGPDDHAVILTAIGEACTNCIDHAYRSRHQGHDDDRAESGTEMIYVVLSDHGPDMVARVTDAGSWRPPGPHSAKRGRGTDIMRALSKRYERSSADGGGTTITLSLRAPDRCLSDEP